MYLDYQAFMNFVSRHHRDKNQLRQRLVGPGRTHDSGYFNIVRFFGPGAIDPVTVPLEYREPLFHMDDPLVETYARTIESELRAAGRLYQGPLVTAVIEERLAKSPRRLTLQPCDYGLFAGACFALDHVHESLPADTRTLREYAFRHHTQLPPCLGVCGLLVTTEPDRSHRLLIVNRAGHLASLTHSIGPSAAGSVDFATHWTNLDQMARESMAAEILEEIGLQSSEYTILFLAYAREMFRGDKPQIFCRIDTPISSADVARRISALTGRREFNDYAFCPVEPDGRLWPDDIHRLNHEAAMNYYLLEEAAASAPPA